MAEESPITEEMRKAMGTELNRFAFDVEKVLVRRLLDCIDDPNPLWKEAVPPSLFITAFAEGGFFTEERIAELPFKMPVSRTLDGGAEWEFLHPARLGDTITGVRKLAEFREREGRLGRMLFITLETTLTNQRNEVVVKGRATGIFY